MKNLNAIMPIIQSTVNEETVNTVNARDLHRGLSVGKVFGAWIQDRIRQCGLMEGVDYIQFSETGKSESRLLKEYHLTLDAAKHLAMLERNERGRLVRQYFIDFEKKAREALPKQTFEEMTLAVLQGLQGKIASQQKLIGVQKELIEEQKPKVHYFEQFMSSKGLFTLREAGQHLGMGSTTFCRMLREDGYLQDGRDGNGRYKNVPYQLYIDNGYFVRQSYGTPWGHGGFRTLVTPKGVKRFAMEYGFTGLVDGACNG